MIKNAHTEIDAARVKDWLPAQLALIDAGGAETAEIFMPYLVIQGPGGALTLYQHFLDHAEQYALPPAAEA